MAIKKTFQDISTFLAHANQFLATRPKEQPDTKLAWALRKLQKRLQKKLERDHGDVVQDLQIDLAEVDEKDVMLRDERQNFKYSKENMKRLQHEQRELFYKETEIEPHIVKESVALKTLTAAQISAFDGFVIEDVEPEEAAPESFPLHLSPPPAKPSESAA